MNRRQILFLVLINALLSLAIALTVAWAIDSRRPDLEELAIQSTVVPQPVLISTRAAVTAVPPKQATSVSLNVVQVQTLPTVNTSRAEVDQTVYTVQAGDSLSTIADSYGVSMNSIIETNELANPNFVFAGQRLVIPVPVARDQEADSQPPQDSTDSSSAATSTPSTQGYEGLRIASVEGVGDINAESALLVNDSNVTFNLSGWTFGLEEGPVYTFGDMPLLPGGSVRINTGRGTDTSISVYWGQETAILQADKLLLLRDSTGVQAAALRPAASE